jgi:hypothetical protein
MRQPAVPYLEPVVGAVWWTVGAAALDGGVGTVVLAAGLGVTAGLVVALHRRHGHGARLPGGERGRLLRVLGITAALVAVSGTVLGSFGLGELVVPVSCVLVGIAGMSLASVLEARSLLAVGAVLLVLGAGGALLALDSAGRLYPQGLVGLGAGAVLWLAAAGRGGLLRALVSGTRGRGPSNTRRLPLAGEWDPTRRGR